MVSWLSWGVVGLGIGYWGWMGLLFCVIMGPRCELRRDKCVQDASDNFNCHMPPMVFV